MLLEALSPQKQSTQVAGRIPVTAELEHRFGAERRSASWTRGRKVKRSSVSCKRVGDDGWKEEAERAECSEDGSSQ